MWNDFVNIVDGFKLYTLVGMILANLLLGVAVAIKLGNFRLNNLSDFLSKTVVPYIVGYYAIGMMALMEDSLKPVVLVVFAFIVASLLAKNLAQLKQLGLPTPDILSSDKNEVKRE